MKQARKSYLPEYRSLTNEDLRRLYPPRPKSLPPAGLGLSAAAKSPPAQLPVLPEDDDVPF